MMWALPPMLKSLYYFAGLFFGLEKARSDLPNGADPSKAVLAMNVSRLLPGRVKLCRSKASQRNKALYGIDVVDRHAQSSVFVFVQVLHKSNYNRS